MLITRIFRYSILGLIIFLILQQGIQYSFGKILSDVGINIMGRSVGVSVGITLIIIMILYMSDSHMSNTRKVGREGFENLVNELVEDTMDEIDDDDFEMDDDMDDEDIEDVDVDTNRGLNDVEIDALTSRTTVSDLGQPEPIQRKNLGGDKEDLEMQEIERLKKENDEMNERMALIEAALLEKLEKNGVIIETEDAVQEYESEVDELKKKAPKSPFLLLSSSVLKTQRKSHNPGCRLPRVNVTNDHFDITKIY